MNREDRKREYEYFSAEQHQAVVLAYLFQGMTVAQAVAELQQAACADYENLIAILCGREVSEFKCAEDIQSETALDYRTAREGRRELIYTTRYERSPILRKRAIQIHGTTCMACAHSIFIIFTASAAKIISKFII